MMNFNIAKSKSFIVFLPNIFLDQLKPNAGVVYTFNEERDIDTVFKHAGTKALPVMQHEYDLDNDEIEDYITPHEQADSEESEDDELEIVQITSAEQIGHTSSYTPTARTVDIMPKLFYTKERLPNTTNLHCWGCAANIVGKPWLMPISVDRTDTAPGDQEPDNSKEFHIELSDYRKQQLIAVSKKARQIKIMKTIGVFHHVWCMGRYLTSPDINFNRWQCIELIKEMFKQIDGRELLQVPVGESPMKMSRFCGPCGISDEEYYLLNLKNLASYVK